MKDIRLILYAHPIVYLELNNFRIIGGHYECTFTMTEISEDDNKDIVTQGFLNLKDAKILRDTLNDFIKSAEIK